MDSSKYIDSDLIEKFEFYNYGHSLEILHESFPEEWKELQECFRKLSLSIDDIKKSGGNESPIPKKFDDILYPYGWREIRISGDLIVKKYPRKVAQRRGKFADEPYEVETITGYIDGHNIDFLKNRVAFDLEWNSKDQTFDRDLLAMRTYFDCGLIDVGVIVTRAEELNDIFREIRDEHGQILMKKYGASTTWMGKLTYRLDSRRNGGCPILAVGIRKECVEDYGRLAAYNSELEKIHKR
ncbi:BglII/BstYI family type II restriction endonuclease [Bilifractor porci]|uniref:Restriction endonuclease n=1 Tax=Bilifractor porci TaxID=2606636 RepID=A0A7X2P750_9FIRM|nr:BglII/BstYI family type II restriction endonuclease [Bilifractor porci]MST80968.1 restriction endonuclease [Bilifractor porci]